MTEATGYDFGIDQEAGRVPEFVPTLEEIAAACAVIRAGWTDADRQRRRRFTPPKLNSTKGVRAAARAAVDHKLARVRSGQA